MEKIKTIKSLLVTSRWRYSRRDYCKQRKRLRAGLTRRSLTLNRFRVVNYFFYIFTIEHFNNAFEYSVLKNLRQKRIRYNKAIAPLGQL